MVNAECAQLLSHVQFFAAPWTVTWQAPLSMEFSGQEHWSGLPFPIPWDLLNPGIEPVSLVSPVTGGFFITNAIYFCFINYAKVFDCVDHNKLWKILKEMGIPGHLTCLPRKLYAGQEATVRTGHGTTDRFQIGKGVCQGCILSPCLFKLHAEYIMRSTGLDEAQARIKIVRRNINNLRYAGDITLMAESEEELKSLWMKVKEEKLRSWHLVPSLHGK